MFFFVEKYVKMTHFLKLEKFCDFFFLQKKQPEKEKEKKIMKYCQETLNILLFNL